MQDGPPIADLTLTRDEFDRGYLIWGGACCTCRGYTLVRELLDGRVLVRGYVSQEPTCQVEVWIAESARKAWRTYGGKPVRVGSNARKAKAENLSDDETDASAGS